MGRIVNDQLCLCGINNFNSFKIAQEISGLILDKGRDANTLQCGISKAIGIAFLDHPLFIADDNTALFKKFCKRDFCDEVRDFKIPEPEAVAS